MHWYILLHQDHARLQYFSVKAQTVQQMIYCRPVAKPLYQLFICETRGRLRYVGLYRLSWLPWL